MAERGADKLGHRYIRNEHLLLGLVESGDSYAGELLTKKGLSTENPRLQLKALPQPTEPTTRRSNRSPPESELIRRVGELVSRGEGQGALQLLDDYMAEAGQDRKLRIRSLGHFAAITAEHLGDLNTARRYCEEFLAYKPDDPMALYALADCLELSRARQVRREGAQPIAVKRHCHEVKWYGRLWLSYLKSVSLTSKRNLRISMR